MNTIDKNLFDEVSNAIFSQLKSGERLTLELDAEETSFVRVNNSKIRQITDVIQGKLTFNFLLENKSMVYTIPISGNREINEPHIKEAFSYLRRVTPQLPDDPYLVEPKNNGNSVNIFEGTVLKERELINSMLSSIQTNDVAGIYAGGRIMRANANYLNQRHWFETTNFYFDYSIYTSKQKAVKGCYAGKTWNDNEFKEQIGSSVSMMKHFEKENIEIKPGKYRVYLAPAAVAEMLGLLNWGTLSFDNYKKGGSSFKELYEKKVKLSPKFSLDEDFSLGLNTQFNSLGEVFVDKLPIIKNGELVNMFISSRSAKEYNVVSNFANTNENLRSPSIQPGTLKTSDILKVLNRGIYISNLHYLNWSDRMKARVTGMTRYACFWVENGEIIAPIKDMRFDDTLYNIWGENLADITAETYVTPSVDSYGHRNIGGERVPGMIINDFTLTL